MKKLTIQFMCLAMITFFSVSVFAFQGTLDTSFGQNGIVTFSGGTSQTLVNDAAVQRDGKVVVVGSTGNPQDRDILLLRYNNDGSLDASFGNNGVIVTPIGLSWNSFAKTVALQTDGKIVIGGGAAGYGSLLIRYNSDGSLDSSFGYGGGILIKGNFFQDIAITQNGEILGVRDIFSGVIEFVVQRFDVNGMLDNSFGLNGIARVGFVNAFEVDLALQADGKIIVASTEDSGVDSNFGVVRLTSNGQTDTSFGNTGRVETDINGNDFASGVVIDQFGSILVVGKSGSPAKMTIVKYRQDGSIDRSFGTTGILPTSLGGIVTTKIGDSKSIAIDQRGHIFVAGTESGTPTKLIVQKLNSKGFLVSWGIGGSAYANLEPLDSTGMAVAFTSRSVFVAGQITPLGSSDREIVVAKFNN